MIQLLPTANNYLKLITPKVITHFPKLVFAICLSLLAPVFTNGQTAAQLFKAGTESLSKGEYYAAARYLKQALDKDDDQAEIWYNYAEACRQFNDYENAAKGYDACVERDNEKAFLMALFWQGLMLQNQGSYSDAKEKFTAFKTRYRKKDFYAQKVQQLIESCSWAMANQRINDSIEIIHESDSINTTFSEINPIVFDGKLQYFSSTKPLQGKVFRTRIYNVINGSIWLPGVDEASIKHVANGSFSTHPTYGNEFFFTQCGIENGNSVCQLFVSKLENGEWQAAKQLPVNVNLPGHTATHPTVATELSGNQWLIFSANRPGGKGKMDIWLSKRLGAFEWDYPQNAGAVINTPDDEVTPFFLAEKNTLFFSSNWHYGYGGFDAFKAGVRSLSASDFEQPKNLGLPINSSANDLYLVYGDSVLYFSSNRKGSKFIEAETCCNDIYKAMEKKPVQLDVVLQMDTTSTQTLIKNEQLENREEVKGDIVVSQEMLTPSNNTQITSSNNKSLSNSRSSLAEFDLPLALYFHNDEPNPKSLTDTTSLTYIETFQSYINLKNTYTTEYGKGINTDEKIRAEQHIQSWFTDTVELNLVKLVQFSSLLLSTLQQGKNISITITGYCSPLNVNAYNIHLGNRRVSSLINFFRSYQNGALLNYINNGKFSIKKVSAGEEKASPNVSDQLNDLRNSVYNPAAARERKVMITAIQVD